MNLSRKVTALALTAILVMSALFAVSSLGAGAGPGVADVVGGADPGGLRFTTVRLPVLEDTTLHSWFPTKNYGLDQNLFLRSGDVSAALLRFDLSSIPSEALVAQATLRLYILGPEDHRTLSAVAYAVNRPWVAREANWLQATVTTRWDQPGCNGVPADRGGTGSDPLEISGAGKWVALDVTHIVQEWVEGVAANRGLIVKTLPGVSVEYKAASAEYYQPAFRPILQVIYGLLPTPTPTGTPPPAVPEPRLSVVKTGPEGPLYDTEVTIHYEISVQNVGTDVAQGIVITDDLPLGVRYQSCTGGGVYNRDDHVITWTVDSLNVGSKVDLAVDVKLADWIKAGGVTVNVVSAGCGNCPEAPATGAWTIWVGPPTPTPTEEVTPTPTPTEEVTPTPTPTIPSARYIQYLVNVRKNFRDVR